MKELTKKELLIDALNNYISLTEDLEDQFDSSGNRYYPQATPHALRLLHELLEEAKTRNEREEEGE